MTTLREAAQQALEALERYRQMMFAEAGCRWDGGDAAITALRAALARQDEPVEPVAYTTGHCENHKQKGGCQLHNLQCGWPDCDRKPTTAPPQQAEPVEPVAWNWMLDGLPYGRACYGDPPDADLAERAATAGRTVRLLYTAPPQRKQAESVQMHPSQFAELIKGKETMIGVPVYWSEWPNKERT